MLGQQSVEHNQQIDAVLVAQGTYESGQGVLETGIHRGGTLLNEFARVSLIRYLRQEQ